MKQSNFVRSCIKTKNQRIMAKGIIFDLQKFALHDGPGIRTTVFLKGCELRCTWCCNPESQLKAPQLSYEVKKCTNCLECVPVCKIGALTKREGKLQVKFDHCIACGNCIEECTPDALKIYGWETDAQTIIEEVKKDKPYFENSGGGLTLSGGDAIFQPEFAMEILKLAKLNGIHTCLETSGYCKPTIMNDLSRLTDLFLFDFKHYKDTEHIKNTGVSNKQVLASLDTLCRQGKPVILRCPIIPGVNNNLQHFKAIADLGNKYEAITAVEVMAFHDWGFHKYEQTGLKRPNIDSATISDETAQSWVKAIREMGCKKIKRG